MPAHLFLTRGDITALHCDALLVPSGIGPDERYGHVGRASWFEELPALRAAARGDYVTPAPSDAERAVSVAAEDRGPAIWLGHTGEDDREPRWFADAAVRFVAGAAAQTRQARHKRPLLAVPLVGTGQGGMAHRKGEVVRALVAGLHRAAQEHEADVVLVLPTPQAFAAAQQARSLLGEAAWTPLSAHDKAAAERLGALAREGKLVLFLGAGVSMGVGVPSWQDLLKTLAQAAELSDAERSELSELDPRDAGRILHSRLEGRLAVEIIDAVSADRVSLQHQLLASLPCNEAVTTNYDDLFERAWALTGPTPRVLPRDPAQDASRWLLKLHGSVDDPDRIVLSRDDYLRLEGHSSALGGLVQAMLLTRHMLFVGYSMQDDNFHRLAHHVRSVLGDHRGRAHGGAFGTALTPSPFGLAQQLWQDDVEFVTTAGTGDAVHRLEVLLDRVVAEAVGPAAHLLDETYGALFSEQEQQIGDALRTLGSAAEERALSTGVRVAITSALDAIRGHVADPDLATPASPPYAEKGSRRQLQLYVNRRRRELDKAIKAAVPDLHEAELVWKSPLERDGFIEYRDGAFLGQLGLARLAPALREVWPARGPVWDGLAIVRRPGQPDGALLVEAKAHVAELSSGSGSRASSHVSRELIASTLEATRRELGASGDTSTWRGTGYQHANRLAHALWLRDQGVDAWLVHLLFAGDRGHKDTTEEDLLAALQAEVAALGLTGREPAWAASVVLPARP